MDPHQRLAEFFKRLQAAPPAGSAREAFDLVCRLMEQVEDELCSIPREDPPPLYFSGRMYPPKEDHVKRIASGAVKANARHHRIFCRSNGAISIFHVPTRSPRVLYKRGKHERAT